MTINRGMDKEEVVHSKYDGILLNHKKEWNNATCSNIDGPGDDHTKRGKSDRERQVSYDITFMWNLERWDKWNYLQTRNRLTDFERKLMVTKAKWLGRGINSEFEINIYT